MEKLLKEIEAACAPSLGKSMTNARTGETVTMTQGMAFCAYARTSIAAAIKDAALQAEYKQALTKIMERGQFEAMELLGNRWIEFLTSDQAAHGHYLDEVIRNNAITLVKADIAFSKVVAPQNAPLYPVDTILARHSPSFDGPFRVVSIKKDLAWCTDTKTIKEMDIYTLQSVRQASSSPAYTEREWEIRDDYRLWNVEEDGQP